MPVPDEKHRKYLFQDLDNSHIHNKWPFAKEGVPFVLISMVLTFLFLYFGLIFMSILTGVISVFITLFFRDPERNNSSHHKAVLTPADGKILEIRHLEDKDNPLGQPAVKVSIFMSVFNVHVNRIPVGGIIKKIIYTPGKFFSANLDKASKYNENNRIILETDDSHIIAFIQIAGLIARRISCWVKEIEHVEAGQRFGLIRFGSRVELYLPYNSKIIARPCQKVRAGETIIGYLS
jgi:phosphatidylserine decarboxylase